MVYRRTINLRAEKANDGKLKILASTDTPVDFGGWKEILLHEGAEIDYSSARALLLNHDPDQIVGPAGEYTVLGGEMWCAAGLLDGARLKSGPTVKDAVDSGALRGVSISYDYNPRNSKEVDVDESTRTITVKKWRLLEVSLTPIPADKTCSVRSYPLDKGTDMDLEQIKAMFAGREAEIDEMHERGMSIDDIHSAMSRAMDSEEDPVGEKSEDFVEEKREVEVEVSEETDDEEDAEEEREDKEDGERAKLVLHLRDIADNYKLRMTSKDFDGCETEADGMQRIIKKQREILMSKHNQPQSAVGPSVTVDAGDKFIRSAGAAMMRSAGIVPDAKDLQYGELHLSAVELVRRCAKIDGNPDADSWNPLEVASYALRRMSYNGQRDAANKISASFSTLTGNVAYKALLNGFNNYNSVYERFCTIKDASNFNVHPHAAAAIGRMQETPEGEALPESNQKEGTYNSQLSMFGHTISVTMQTIVNDELGEVMSSFGKQGYVAGRTIDYQVFYKILNATYTNDTTTGAALGTAGNLDKVRSDLKDKLSPAGEKMDNDPKILLVDSANRYNADAATGQLYGVATGANAQTGSNAVRGIEVIDSTWIGDTSLYASALATDYYLLGDPMIVDTVCVEFLRGMRVPQILPFDAGSGLSSNFKVYLPFQATVATHTDSAGNARVSGIQKATVA